MSFSGSAISLSIMKSFFAVFLVLACNDTTVLLLFILIYQRAGDSPAAGSPRSVSPADFFSQIPKEKPSFQIPVSAGDPLLSHVMARGCFSSPCHVFDLLNGLIVFSQRDSKK